ncbi:hypothetical protein DSM19430T_22380 [Desulfovibrio psychrotolerans]|uniref:Uncharacterized protein n=1 Tax=Desulfovibrio psychrotolerans TaxID=415242 RepID=A0A7J0BX52_9BACT|nr:hypothetical protein DSM19430T_22380 [Desulfovibrio psychrotolerans]
MVEFQSRIHHGFCETAQGGCIRPLGVGRKRRCRNGGKGKQAHCRDQDAPQGRTMFPEHPLAGSAGAETCRKKSGVPGGRGGLQV